MSLLHLLHPTPALPLHKLSLRAHPKGRFFRFRYVGEDVAVLVCASCNDEGPFVSVPQAYEEEMKSRSDKVGLSVQIGGSINI